MSRDEANTDADADEFQQKLSAAARGSAIGRVAESSTTGQALLVAMGGVRGIVEALLPGILFLVLFVVTGRMVAQDGTVFGGLDPLWISVGVPALAGFVFVITRVLRREPTAAALGGLIGLVVSGILALRSGEGADFFLIGFWTNGAYGTAFVVSMLVGWPIIGVLAGALYGSWRDWRSVASIRRWMQVITAVWAAFFFARLAVQLPLYFSGAVEALGLARLLMGPPLFGVLVVITVLYVRAVFRPPGDAQPVDSDSAAPSDNPRA